MTLGDGERGDGSGCALVGAGDDDDTRADLMVLCSWVRKARLLWSRCDSSGDSVEVFS